ncbi:50S ribosomal protein L15 [Mariniplasma anaerobium]|uniref:Large ribosomal subunit protein uL15 n=1 Tax=Mariniplasma anaerobium TaxID=2735436 RepID=A0A7U9TLE0_9MOLU|nr:50S ribosomal protein L15 [Mariniplasma anaerobium]BCR35348.1 50S ribosomal protein L15 [Mariniplasma anaerobium]
MLNELRPVAGARKKRKRLGRGPGSGTGGTSGKGDKGQLARSGGGPRPGFEGGQLPFFQRLPKRGFKNVNRKEFAVINMSELNLFNDGDVVTPEALIAKNVLKKLQSGVKVLANGNLEKKLTVKAHSFSKAAEAAIVKAGGTVEVI